MTIYHQQCHQHKRTGSSGVSAAHSKHTLRNSQRLLSDSFVVVRTNVDDLDFGEVVVIIPLGKGGEDGVLGLDELDIVSDESKADFTGLD
jgi:hypothetical protein